jgi:poly(3-hydroxyalkanoate) synthetase
MPAANHSFYLRNCYLNNTLAKGQMVLGNVRLDGGATTPAMWPEPAST